VADLLKTKTARDTVTQKPAINNQPAQNPISLHFAALEFLCCAITFILLLI